jgi:hypothetical protein
MAKSNISQHLQQVQWDDEDEEMNWLIKMATQTSLAKMN